MAHTARAPSLIALVLGAALLPGRAEASPTCKQRVRFLEARVEAGAKRSLQWSLGWGIGLGALAVGQVAISPVFPAEERIDYYVGAVAASVGALTRAVFIPRVIGHRRRLRRARSTEDACVRLRALELDVAADAQWERKGRGLLMHGLNLGFNAAVGVVLGVAFKRPVPGNRLASIGAVVGEVMIITQPTYVSRSMEAYERGELTRRSIRSAPWVLPGGGGFVLGGRM